MDSTSLQRVTAFVAKHLNMQPHEIQLSSRLAEDLGVAGDDGLELIEAYAEALGVDISEFRSPLHFGREPSLTVETFVIGILLIALAFAGYATPWTIPISVVALILGYRWLVRRDMRSGPFTLTVADLVAYAEAGTWAFDYERAQQNSKT